MASFADFFTLQLGEVTVKGRRLTVKELRAGLKGLADGEFDIESAVRMVRDHVTLADGSPFDPEDLSPDQLKQIVVELTLPKEGRGISDFIGLLSLRP